MYVFVGALLKDLKELRSYRCTAIPLPPSPGQTKEEEGTEHFLKVQKAPLSKGRS